MIKRRIEEFNRGWFIGNFEPSVFKTDKFEIALIKHIKNEIWPMHYHAIATEYNLLIEGRMKVCGEIIEEGDLFILEPHEIANPEFIEDCKILCIKIPSIKGDKYEIF